MLISLFFWTYLSIICLIWGHMFFSAMTAVTAVPAVTPATTTSPVTSSLHTCLLCLAGLAVISTLALFLSLFMPLDWKAHTLLLIGALIHLLKEKPREEIRALLINVFKNFTPLQYGLLAACITMVLVISVHSITHPDTLIYHARSILLFQRYRTIPGVANLLPHFGFQSGWFAALALCNPTPWHTLIFLNGAVLCWFFIFVISTWNNTWLGWLLLAYTLFSWIQVRLTAASASPDFIVSLFSFAAFYTYLKKDDRNADQQFYPALTILCCMAAILTKLSAIPLLLLAAAATDGYRKTRPVRYLIIYSGAALVILCIKNVLTSGYLLYPAAVPDLFNVDWKMPLSRLQQLQLYISRYATIPSDEPTQPFPLSWTQRISGWWSYIDNPERLLLLAILGGLLANLIILVTKGKKSLLFAWNKYTKALVIAFIGSMIWLWNAPSPRFGTGFLIPLLYLLFYHLPQPALKITRLFTLVAGYCLFTAISAYTVYRCIYFLAPSNLAIPSGIAASAYEPVSGDNIRVDLLHNTIEKVQSSDTSTCVPIGHTIQQGFKPGK